MLRYSSAYALFATLFLLDCPTFASGLSVGAGAVTVDGRLDEPAWRSAVWHDDYRRLKDQENLGPIARKTAFAILCDDRTLYIGVRCAEPDVDRLKGDQDNLIWDSDAVEFFLCPNGRSFDFYQFSMSPVSKTAHVGFFSENGAIQPDPYAPQWKRAFAFGNGEWTVEVEIPLSSFYMTRNADWKGKWLVNATRTLRKPSGWISWSPLEKSFYESTRFRSIEGFPLRQEADDFFVKNVLPEIAGMKDGKPAGKVKMEVYCAVGGDYTYAFAPGEGRGRVTLKKGWNTLTADCRYPAAGRHMTDVTFTRTADGRVYSRRYPAMVNFEALGLKVTCPAYRNNFYPGQCADRVEGEVSAFDGGQVTLELSGPGFQTRTTTVVGCGRFSFDTRGFEKGAATLTARSAGGETRSVKIRNLPPTKSQMVWIENGHLVVNGRPVLRRNLYAEGYCGGRKLDEKYAREAKEFFLTPEFRTMVNVTAGALVPGLESKEAAKDVVPSEVYLKKIKETVEKNRGKDFGSYYISDEPECRNVSEVYLGHVYRLLCELDPYHPVLTASRGGVRYLECADWFETHPYLAPRVGEDGSRKYGVAPEKFGDYLDAFKAWDRPDKCIGFLPTCFAYRWMSPKEDYPTFDEYLATTFGAMMRGGKSLWPYAYHDLGDRPALWDGTKYLFESFAALDMLFLEGKRRPFGRTAKVDGALYERGHEKMMVAVNLTSSEQVIDASDVKGRFREFRGRRMFGREGLAVGKIVLRPFETLVATTDEHDRGMIPIAKVREQALREERERTTRDNQLLERHESIAVLSNIGQAHGDAYYKLFDGMYDQLSRRSEWKDDPYLEMSFAGFKPVFRKIRIHGFGLIDKAVVSIRKDGTWRRLAPVSSTGGEYLRELDFGETLSSVKMRIDFPGAKGQRNTLELYEIELPKVAGAAGRGRTAAGPRGQDVGTMWTFPPFKANAHTNVMVDVAAAPRMLVVDVDSFEDISGNGFVYRNWTVRLQRQGLMCSTVTDPRPGLYTIRVPAYEKDGRDQLALYHYGIKSSYAKIAMMERPADAVYVESSAKNGMITPGDTIDVTVVFAAPCEEVSAEIVQMPSSGCTHPFPVNGKSGLDLKKADAEGRRWTARLTVEESDKAEARRVYVRVVALGGELARPLFGNFVEGFQGMVR